MRCPVFLNVLSGNPTCDKQCSFSILCLYSLLECLLHTVAPYSKADHQIYPVHWPFCDYNLRLKIYTLQRYFPFLPEIHT